MKNKARLIHVTRDDGARLRLVHWPVSGGQPVLILPGRAEPAEKYSEVIGELTERGFSTFALDWRGQGLSDRRPDLGERGHVEDFDILAGDLAAVLERIGGHPLVLAHSMGAAVTLRLCQIQPQAVAAVAGMFLCGPMTRLPTWGYPERLVRVLCRLQRLIGRGRRYVWGASDWEAESHAFEGNRRTRSRTRFDREVTLLRSHPDLRVGGPTWGWLDAAFRLTDRLRGPWPPGAPKLPMDVIVGAADPYTSVEDQRAFFGRFPGVRLHVLAGGLHEVMMETDDVRAQFWKVFDTATRPLAPTCGAREGQDRHTASI